MARFVVPEGGSDPTKLLGGLAAKKRGSIKVDVKKKHFPFRKERSVFLTSSSRPRLRGEHASILVVTAGTFRIMLLVADAEHSGTSKQCDLGNHGSI